MGLHNCTAALHGQWAVGIRQYIAGLQRAMGILRYTA